MARLLAEVIGGTKENPFVPINPDFDVFLCTPCLPSCYLCCFLRCLLSSGSKASGLAPSVTVYLWDCSPPAQTPMLPFSVGVRKQQQH